jgi:DNA phosphorothioation-associated putative methyltransferase
MPAIRRTGPSLPLKEYLKFFPASELADKTILDYGCGHGKDVEYLNGLGLSAIGWDPSSGEEKPVVTFDLVFLTYVLNVISTPEERFATLNSAWANVDAGGRLVVACRTEKEIEKEAKKNGWEKFNDGYLTKAKSFQKGIDGLIMLRYFGQLNECARFFCQEKKYLKVIFERRQT